MNFYKRWVSLKERRQTGWMNQFNVNPLPSPSLGVVWAWWGGTPGAAGWRWFCWSRCCLLPAAPRPRGRPDPPSPPSPPAWTPSWCHRSSRGAASCWSSHSLIFLLFPSLQAESDLSTGLKLKCCLISGWTDGWRMWRDSVILWHCLTVQIGKSQCPLNIWLPDFFKTPKFDLIFLFKASVLQCHL